MTSDPEKCQKIINGVVCKVSNDELNHFKQHEQLVHSTSKTENLTKTDLFTKQGDWVGTAIKNGESDIRLITKRSTMF